jgi:hypothetical protein
MTEETQTPEAPQQSQQAGPQESTDLTVADLNMMKTIIDLSSSRGAFKPNEMVAVGSVYTKLTNFLATVAKAPTAGV